MQYQGHFKDEVAKGSVQLVVSQFKPLLEVTQQLTLLKEGSVTHIFVQLSILQCVKLTTLLHPSLTSS